jgi:hypothetical protein
MSNCHSKKTIEVIQQTPIQSTVSEAAPIDTAKIIYDAIFKRTQMFRNLNRSHRVLDSTMKRIIPSQNAQDYMQYPTKEIVK